MAAAEDTVVGRDEFMQVQLWRFDQARDLGLTTREAAEFAAGDGDLSMLRRLIIDCYCEPHTAFRILA